MNNAINVIKNPLEGSKSRKTEAEDRTSEVEDRMIEINAHPSPRNPESPKQDKPKAKHPRTHINQINKDQTQRTNVKSSKGKTTNNTQRDSHKDNR